MINLDYERRHQVFYKLHEIVGRLGKLKTNATVEEQNQKLESFTRGAHVIPNCSSQINQCKRECCAEVDEFVTVKAPPIKLVLLSI